MTSQQIPAGLPPGGAANGSGHGRYQVTIERTELITFELAAVSLGDAEARFLADGEETASKTAATTVVEVSKIGGDCS